MSDQNNDGGFHKGLFYGMILGVGLVWFLGTKEGKKIKDELLNRGQNLLDQAENKLETALEENSETFPE